MMGDNRDNSLDSRFDVGFVPVENLVGRAKIIFFSIARRRQPAGDLALAGRHASDRACSTGSACDGHTPRPARNARTQPFGSLEERLGYTFTDYASLERALTHASARKQADGSSTTSGWNFSATGCSASSSPKCCSRCFPTPTRANLSLRLNAAGQCANTCAEMADELDLHEFIRTGADLKELDGASACNPCAPMWSRR